MKKTLIFTYFIIAVCVYSTFVNAQSNSFEYDGKYTFQNEEQLEFFGESNSLYGELSILDSFYSHKNILKFEDNNASGEYSIQNLFVNQYSGIIEFWLYITNEGSIVILLTEGLNDAVGFYITISNSGIFGYYNGSSWVATEYIKIDRWNHYKLCFNKDETFSNVTINNELVIDIKARSSYSYISRFKISPPNLAKTYLDSLDYSWSENYYEGRSLDLIEDTTNYTWIILKTFGVCAILVISQIYLTKKTGSKALSLILTIVIMLISIELWEYTIIDIEKTIIIFSIVASLLLTIKEVFEK